MNRIDIVTNILDAVAFLLVTVELYGRERLEALRQNLLGVKVTTFNPAEPFLDVKTGTPMPLRIWLRLSVGLILAFAGIFVVMYFGFDLLGLAFGTAWTMPSLDDYEFFFFTIGICAAFGVLSYFIWFLRGFAVHGALYLMKIFRLDGMMIVTGASLFILTRLILVGYALHGDHEQKLNCQPASATVLSCTHASAES